MEFRDLKRQYDFLKEEIDDAMKSVALSGAFINGPAVKELETELAEYVGVKHCISCANGTDALTVALKIWNIGPGDAVFVPDFTFFSSAETIAAEGAVPVFVDVDEKTFNIDCNNLEEKLKRVKTEGKLKPKAIVAVDLFGLPAPWPELKMFADENGLLMLEDGAQGFGGTIAVDGEKRRACSFGDIATTSFFPAKPLGCYGDGGAIFTNNEDWASMANSLKVHGKGSSKYDNVRIGMNSRLDTLQAAILNVKFKAFKERELDFINKASELYSRLLLEKGLVADCAGELEQGKKIMIPQIPQGYISSWAQYTIRVKDSETRTSLQDFLKGKGIPAMVYYPSGMHSQTAFKGFADYGPCPVCDLLCSTVLSLPIHPYITEYEINTVVEAIAEWRA